MVFYLLFIAEQRRSIAQDRRDHQDDSLIDDGLYQLLFTNHRLIGLIFLEVDARSDVSEEYNYQDDSMANEEASDVSMTGIREIVLHMR